MFDRLTSLEGLTLYANRLTTLPDRAFDRLTSLVRLRLEDNPGAPFAPVAAALPDDGTVSSGGTVTLDGSGSGGAWGTNVTYSWVLTTPTSGVTVTFDDDTSAMPVVTIPALPVATELIFTLTVTGHVGTDGIASATDTAKVTVTTEDNSSTQTYAPPLTARFANLPGEHDGERAFKVEIVFGEVPAGMNNVALRAALQVTGGTVTKLRRVNLDRAHRIMTIRPDGWAAVDIVLPESPDCEVAGALCTEAGGRLEAGLVTRVPGPAATATPAPGPAPLTARFANLPGEHDGETAFTVEIVFGEAPSGKTNKVLRAALQVTGGTVTKVRRVNRDRAHRIVTIRPEGWAAVDIVLPESPDCAAAGALCTEAGGRLEAGLLTQVRGPAALRVADAEVREAANATLAFAVTLDRAPSGTVSVDYATADGTATAGSDYTAASGTLTFAAGERSKTVAVAVLDDAHDEGSETLTLTLTLSNPSGAYIADGTATGTIENTDAMPQAWIARFGAHGRGPGAGCGGRASQGGADGRDVGQPGRPSGSAARPPGRMGRRRRMRTGNPMQPPTGRRLRCSAGRRRRMPRIRRG